jgi:hypothetical protein
MSSTDYTATGGIDQQTLGKGVINNFTCDAVSNYLDCIYTPAYTGPSPATWRQTLRVYDRVGAHEPIDNRQPVVVESRSTGNP